MRRLLFAVITMAWAAMPTAWSQVFIDFTVSDGGFVPSVDYGTAAWVYGPGTGWVTDQDASSQIVLTSPAFLADADDPVLTFSHSYDFESGFDFGRVQLSINEGPVSELASYTGAGSGDPSLTLTGVTAGDSFRILFQGSWDHVTTFAAPNWVIDSVAVTGASVPEPGAASLLLTAVGWMAWRRRRSTGQG